MKISKRILGIALAIIMIFNVFAVGTFAAVSADTAIKLIVVSKEDNYAPGSTATFTVYAQTNDEIPEVSIKGTYLYCYNSAVLAPVSTNKQPVTDHNLTPTANQLPGTDMDNAQVIFSETLLDPNGLFALEFSDADVAAGWDAAIAHSIPGKLATLVNEASVAAPVELYSFDMKIADDAATGEYQLGFSANAYGEYYCADFNEYQGASGDYNLDASNLFEFENATFTVGAAAPSVVVTHKGTQSKWNNAEGKAVAADYLFGFLGNVSGLELTTVKDQTTGKAIVQEIKSITATATINGTPVTEPVQTVWVDANGGYTFRAQFANATPDKTDSVSVTFAITMSDGTTVYKTADAATATIKDIYDLSVTRGLPALEA